MAKKIITLPFPAAGLDRSRAYGEQPGLTTLDCENVRPQASNEDRQRGGRRPGLAPQFLMRDKDDVTLSDKMRMANQVRYVVGTVTRKRTFRFEDGIPSDWDAFSWPPYNGNAPATVANGLVYTGTGQPDAFPDADLVAGIALDQLTPWDRDKPYVISVMAFPNLNSPFGSYEGHWHIPLFMDQGNPVVTTNGWRARIEMVHRQDSAPGDPANQFTAHLESFENGFLTNLLPPPGFQTLTGVIPIDATVEFIITVNPVTGNVKLQVRGIAGTTLPVLIWSVAYPATRVGDRWGFGIWATGDGLHKQFVNRVTFDYTETSASATVVSENQTILVAGCNGKVLREGSSPIFLDQVPGSEDDELSNGTQTTNRQLQSVDYGGKLYIADHEHRASGTDGDSSTTLKLKTAIDLIAAGVNEDHDVLVVTGPFRIDPDNPNKELIIGVYDISAVTDEGDGAWSVTVDRVIVRETTTYTNIEFRIERAGKVFNPAADSVVKWIQAKWNKNVEGDGSTFANGPHPWLTDADYGNADETAAGDHQGPKGSIPTGAPAIAVFIDRIWLAGKPEDPHVWYASRQGDPLDWDLGADANDPTAAVAATTTLAGAIPEAITAFVPYGSDYMVISTTSSLWVLRGDPGFGGRIDNLSRTIGILDKFAWARGPSNEMVFLTSNGLYALAPGASSVPVPFSRERLPRELLNIDPAQFSISMAYDQNQQGYSLFLSSGQAGAESHWFIDGKTGGFFPTKHSAPTQNPLVAFEWTRDDANSIMLVGDLAAQLTSYDDTSVKDVLSEFSDFVLIGPFDLNDGFRDGVLTELRADLPRNPSDVNLDWKLAVGDTADEAAQNAADGTWFDTGTFQAGFNPTARVRARGYSAVLRIGTTATEHSIWSVEQLSAILKPAGKRRVLA